jgi:predicted dehydrogenase
MYLPDYQYYSRDTSRRKFIKYFSLSTGIAALAISGAGYFAKLMAAEDQVYHQGGGSGKKLGIALVGLGSYSTGQLAPALQETSYCKLAGIVTGTPSKAVEWKKKYNIADKNVYNYDNFDTIEDNPDIDIVYVVLPNAMHAEYTIRAAKAGKHVICEKPMAVSVKECEQMIAACKEAGKMLSIGYRLHFEPHNLEMMRLGQKQIYGPVNSIETANGFVLRNPDVWRLDRKLSGGGPLMDMGIYSVQGARYVMGKEPVAVTARTEKTMPKLFDEVEETLYWQMEFPGDAVANCQTSYAKSLGNLRAEADKGWFELEPAFSYSGIKGRTNAGKMNLPQVNQQALQMDDFAYCILNNKPTRIPGEEGLRDMKVIEAIYKAAATGKKVNIS